MLEARYLHEIVVVDGEIYVIGGRSNSKIINTMEILNLQNNTWTTAPQMNEKRHEFSVSGRFLLKKLFIIAIVHCCVIIGQNIILDIALKTITYNSYIIYLYMKFVSLCRLLYWEVTSMLLVVKMMVQFLTRLNGLT